MATFNLERESVATTWLMNFRAVEEESPASAELLRFTAFVAPNDIPFELLVDGAHELGPTLNKALTGVGEEPLKLHEVLKPLARYSLIRIERTNKTYGTHRLVQKVTKHALGKSACHSWASRAVAAMRSAIPNPDFSNWPLCSRLAPHTEQAIRHITDNLFDSDEAGDVCSYFGQYLMHQGQYLQAEPLFKQAAESCCRTLGEDHLESVKILNNLAQMYEVTGRYEEAEPLYKQTVEAFRRTLGEDHPVFAASLNNLAAMYSSMGRYQESEELYKQALEAIETCLGDSHPSTNQVRANYKQLLAKKTSLLRRFKDATRNMWRRARSIISLPTNRNVG